MTDVNNALSVPERVVGLAADLTDSTAYQDHAAPS